MCYGTTKPQLASATIEQDTSDCQRLVSLLQLKEPFPFSQFNQGTDEEAHASGSPCKCPTHAQHAQIWTKKNLFWWATYKGLKKSILCTPIPEFCRWYCTYLSYISTRVSDRAKSSTYFSLFLLPPFIFLLLFPLRPLLLSHFSLMFSTPFLCLFFLLLNFPLCLCWHDCPCSEKSHVTKICGHRSQNS